METEKDTRRKAKGERHWQRETDSNTVTVTEAGRET